jgi:mannosyltransferase
MGGIALAGVVGLAALLRFATLGDQSFWYDEALTLELVDGSFGGVLDEVHDFDANPPLYYAAAWVWTRIFGDSEWGLRSLSALIGTATVPVVYAAARELLDRLAALAAAGLVAVSPVMIWYAQEGRAYALVVLLCALAFLFFVHTLRSPGAPRPLAGWALTSALALCTHYFSLLVIVPMAAWLLLRVPPVRRSALAVGAVAATGLALLPLALYQRDHGGVEWITDLPLQDRMRDVVKVLVAGTADIRPWPVLPVAAALAAAVVLVAWRGDARARRGVLVAGGLGAAAIVLPLAGAAVGVDYILDRNLLTVFVLLVIALASAVAVPELKLVGAALVVVVVAVFVRYDAKHLTNDHLERDDWRAVARALGPAESERVVVVAPRWQARPLRLYSESLRPMSGSRPVEEVAILVFSRPNWGRDAPPQPPPRGGFRVVERRIVQRTTLTRFRAARPTRIGPVGLATPGANGSGVFLETGGY